jgi:hypothetical protein
VALAEACFILQADGIRQKFSVSPWVFLDGRQSGNVFSWHRTGEPWRRHAGLRNYFRVCRLWYAGRRLWLTVFIARSPSARRRAAAEMKETPLSDANSVGLLNCEAFTLVH